MTGHILYSFRRCPYAMRARMALKLAEVDYAHREVSLRDKPPPMLDISPKGSVPVFLRDDGRVLDESLDILRWALPHAKLDDDLIEKIDGPFKRHLDRYKYASRFDETAKRGDVDLGHRALAIDVLYEIEGRLTPGFFLSGANIGPTDIAIFPFVRQFAAVEPDWWTTESGLPLTVDWLKDCVQSDVFISVMEKFPLWTPPDDQTAHTACSS